MTWGDVRRDDEATARGRATWTRFPSSRSQSGTRAGDTECCTSRKWAANQRRGQPSQRNACVHMGGTSDPLSRCIINSKCIGNDAFGELGTWDDTKGRLIREPG